MHEVTVIFLGDALRLAYQFGTNEVGNRYPAGVSPTPNALRCALSHIVPQGFVSAGQAYLEPLRGVIWPLAVVTHGALIAIRVQLSPGRLVGDLHHVLSADQGVDAAWNICSGRMANEA